MIKQLFWLGIGIAAGAAIYRTLNDRAGPCAHRSGKASPTSAAATFSVAVRNFVDDMKSAMSEREYQLRDSLGESETRPEGVRAIFAEPSYSGRHAAP